MYKKGKQQMREQKRGCPEVGHPLFVYRDYLRAWKQSRQ
jgi:hypothetical protein